MTAAVTSRCRLEVASQIRESIGWLWHPVRLKNDDARELTSEQLVD